MTFLFTDIEGSTRAWIRSPEAMRVALIRHDAIIEKLVRQYGGQVVRPRGEGDSRFAVFARATDALVAACAIERALLREVWPVDPPLRIRIALHTGEGDLRTGDYYGPAVNHCARMRAVGHGAQVLVSSITAELVRESLDSDVQLQDLGEHQLRDLDRPEHVWQLVHPDLPRDFPPLASLHTAKHNLPDQATSFIGRREAVDAVKSLLTPGDARLVTVTGPGGIGKTRLTLQVGAELVESYPDGVFFVSLAPITDRSLVPVTIAETLGLGEPSGRSALQEIKEYIRAKRILLILDNLEHLHATASLISDLLAGSSGLSVLTTSRIILRLAGEQLFDLPPMDRPSSMSVDPEAAMQYDAVRLFIERAKAVQVDFALTAENARSVVEICNRLDGLPLAIELAASRVRLLPPHALLARLSSRLEALGTGPRDAPARQRTLRDMIAWSYELLTTQEQHLFQCLGVFGGGFTLEAAEAVANSQRPHGIGVLDGVASLVDQSLVKRLDDHHGEPRFGLLQTVREYALECAVASGLEPGARQRHAAFFLALAEAAVRELHGPNQAAWLGRLEHEHDNLRGALSWAISQHPPDMGLRFVASLAPFWIRNGYLHDGLNFADRLLSQSDGGPPQLRAPALAAAGQLSSQSGDYATARVRIESALGLWRELQDSSGIARGLSALGYVVYVLGDHSKGKAILEESIALLRTMGDAPRLAGALRTLGWMAGDRGDLESAECYADESLALAQTARDSEQYAHSLRNIYNIAWRRGDFERATKLCSERLALHSASANKPGEATAVHDLAIITRDRGDYLRAREIHGCYTVSQDGDSPSRRRRTIHTPDSPLGRDRGYHGPAALF